MSLIETQRSWVEVVFVPGEPTEKKDREPLCSVGLRLLKHRGVLLAGRGDLKHDAVVSNLWDWEGARLFEWTAMRLEPLSTPTMK